MYDLHDSEQSHTPPAKRPITEMQSGSSESKRVRIEHEEPEKSSHSIEHDIPSDTPAADTKRGKRDAAGWAKSRRGKAKNTKNKGRRRGTRDQDKDGEKEGEEQGPRAPRLPKKQSALLIGFCGTGCNGMQMYAEFWVFSFALVSWRALVLSSISTLLGKTSCVFSCPSAIPALLTCVCNENRQPDVRTIEGVLFDALVRAGAVSSDNADDPVKVEHLHDAYHDALLRGFIFLGKSWARSSHRRGSPRSWQPGIYETDHRDSWGGRLGGTCK
jgi:tRNA pseudouridine38-40 synthase